jgi:hypothetical protein
MDSSASQQRGRGGPRFTGTKDGCSYAALEQSVVTRAAAAVHQVTPNEARNPTELLPSAQLTYLDEACFGDAARSCANAFRHTVSSDGLVDADNDLRRRLAAYRSMLREHEREPVKQEDAERAAAEEDATCKALARPHPLVHRLLMSLKSVEKAATGPPGAAVKDFALKGSAATLMTEVFALGNIVATHNSQSDAPMNSSALHCIVGTKLKDAGTPFSRKMAAALHADVASKLAMRDLTKVHELFDSVPAYLRFLNAFLQTELDNQALSEQVQSLYCTPRQPVDRGHDQRPRGYRVTAATFPDDETDADAYWAGTAGPDPQYDAIGYNSVAVAAAGPFRTPPPGRGPRGPSQPGCWRCQAPEHGAATCSALFASNSPLTPAQKKEQLQAEIAKVEGELARQSFQSSPAVRAAAATADASEATLRVDAFALTRSERVASDYSGDEALSGDDDGEFLRIAAAATRARVAAAPTLAAAKPTPAAAVQSMPQSGGATRRNRVVMPASFTPVPFSRGQPALSRALDADTAPVGQSEVIAEAELAMHDARRLAQQVQRLYTLVAAVCTPTTTSAATAPADGIIQADAGTLMRSPQLLLGLRQAPNFLKMLLGEQLYTLHPDFKVLLDTGAEADLVDGRLHLIHATTGEPLSDEQFTAMISPMAGLVVQGIGSAPVPALGNLEHGLIFGRCQELDRAIPVVPQTADGPKLVVGMATMRKLGLLLDLGGSGTVSYLDEGKLYAVPVAPMLPSVKMRVCNAATVVNAAMVTCGGAGATYHTLAAG